MKYTIPQALEILERTPLVCTTLLKGLSDDWVMNNEGPETFSPFDVMGHLIHGEKTDWATRAKMILEFGNTKTFVPWDRFAQYEESKDKSLAELLDEFARVRKENMDWFKSLHLTEDDLNKTGMHPVLGEVTLQNLLSTWVVHDLTHIAQITRVMAKQYTENMGPWPQFFRILNF
jgi:DinB superfamily